jgi:protoporphyrinogen oxidase
MMKRRAFIQASTTLAGLSFLAPACTSHHGSIPGEIVGASAAIGHLLRDGKLAGLPPVSTASCEVVIVGGGISGLSAARWLRRHGIDDIRVLDLEHLVGGNAASGHNAVSAYPWGAHYIPIPNNDLTEYLDFLHEAGIITGYDDKGLPIYNEYDLCFDPQERLYLNGEWQTDLIPRVGLPPADHVEIGRFLKEMEAFRLAKGSDGAYAFAIPVDSSSKDPSYTVLDQQTMVQWLDQHHYNSPYLRWYVNYCMRDDFGTTSELISAWVGIHYYASRKGMGSNAKHYDVLTWPQGNGRLVEQLTQPIKDNLQLHSLVIGVDPDKMEVRYYDTQTQQVKALNAQHIILAVPQFVVNRLLTTDDYRARIVENNIHYTPWVVANLTVGELQDRPGAPLSWDNVVYGGESLGYVEATHQQIGQIKEKKVLTWYWPLTHPDPVAARKWALQRTHAEWVSEILNDLRTVHPDLEKQTERIDVMVWGHAMAQPRAGWIFDGARTNLQLSFTDHIHFAHTDLAGISIFEEGFYQGIKAANKILEGRHA